MIVKQSIVAMMLPTNDGFVGLDALRVPRWRGTYTYYLNGYDAGTEALASLLEERDRAAAAGQEKMTGPSNPEEGK